MVTCQCRLGGEVSDGGHALSIVTPEEPCFKRGIGPGFSMVSMGTALGVLY